MGFRIDYFHHFQKNSCEVNIPVSFKEVKMVSRQRMLFEPIRIRSMELRNRFVRSATYDGFSEEGFVTEKQMDLYKRLAQGGVGLIITGITCVHRSGQISKFQNFIFEDAFIPKLRELTIAVHQRGAKIAIQLFHAGREARFPKSSNQIPLGPSFVDQDPYFKGHYRSLTENEIWEIVQAFGHAAIRAREAGFDAIQIHGAHGYLLSQFLSPYTNRRKDPWGGDLKNRLRIHREIYQEIRERVGRDFPILIKIGVQDGIPGGLEFSEGILAAQYLAEWGFDALEISHGLRGKGYESSEFRTGIHTRDQEAYFRHWSGQIKSLLKVPILLVGGLRTFELIEEIVKCGDADLISLSRPLIREPDLILRWEKGYLQRAKCISCNRCLEGLMKGKTLECQQGEG